VSLIEAEAAGVPVVGTRVGGVASVVLDGETGRLAAREDETGFAACVREVLEDPAGSETMGAQGRDHASETFGLDRLTTDIDRLYQEALVEAPLTTLAPAETPRA
jgi:glycosyltransferase involved in cell wall biosynthesis